MGDLPQEELLSQPQVTTPKSKKHRKKLLYCALCMVVLLVIVGVGGYFFMTKNSQEVATNNSIKNEITVYPATPTLIPTIADGVLEKAPVKVAYIRGNSIYLYDNGQEKIVATQKNPSTQVKCYYLVVPLVSPNSKYISYIEQQGQEPSYGGCKGGLLKLYEIATGKTIDTPYTTDYAIWNSDNYLQFETLTGSSESTISTFIVYDPITQRETATEKMKYTQRDRGVRGFLIYNKSKIMRFKDDAYYLVNQAENSEKLLVKDATITVFRGWSPDGVYALFNSTKIIENPNPVGIWYAYNTIDTTQPRKEIKVESGAAGGEPSTGEKWFFNRAFVSHCSQSLSYLDGKNPMVLTNSGGGGCHNEEGFVSTSPDGAYAFLKFSDRFELYGSDGTKKIISETMPMPKGRGAPKNLIWLSNDYMAIFESTYKSDHKDNKATLFLYDRNANTITPIVENAYIDAYN